MRQIHVLVTANHHRLVHCQSSSHWSHHPVVQAAVIFQEGNLQYTLIPPWSKKDTGTRKSQFQKIPAWWSMHE